MKTFAFLLVLMVSSLSFVVHGQDYPLELFSIVPRSAGGIRTPHDNHLHVGEPRIIPEPSTGSFICLFQEDTGNFRILRSLSAADCTNNVGALIYQSGVRIPLPPGQQYFTRMQWNGNLFTRSYTGDNENDPPSKGVWKTVSPQAYDHMPFWLVLNQDDTLDILDENATSIWNSVDGESCIRTDTWGESCGIHRPLALLQTIPRDQRTIGPNSSPIVLRDDLTESHVCVIQELTGNFRVVRGNDCSSNMGDVLFESGFSVSTNDTFVTHLQRDGNLITRHSVTQETAWKTCSYQGYIQEYELVLTSSNVLAIVGADGNVAWESTRDNLCG